jgi:hypothetical protein
MSMGDLKKNHLLHFGFVVNETPYCLWDVNLEKTTLQFVKGIDPKYFEHIARIHGNLLEGEERKYAATALRVAYGQGLETLFALIGAVVQAPHFIVGWMLKYKNSELYDLINKINSRRLVLTQMAEKDVSWQSISNLILQKVSTGDSEHDQKIREEFANLWERFATDFLDENKKYEYNSIKHGSRAAMGGLKLTIGRKPKPRVADASEKMLTLLESEFGASFFVPENLGNSRNFTLNQFHATWRAENLIAALQLISVSIDNILNFIKMLYVDDGRQIKFSFPLEFEDFQRPWREVGEGVVKMGSVIRKENIEPLTANEILNNYAPKS